MHKLVIAAIALVILGIPAAFAASPSAQKPTSVQAQGADDDAAKPCRAERQRDGLEAFEDRYGTNKNKRNAFGKCVSSKSKAKSKGQDKDDVGDNNGQKDDDGAAANACRSEQASMRADAFAKKYGTNHNLKNAFGKCISGKSKAKG
jgi:hypothetical protein